MNIMTANHPRWNEFVERLEGKEGCDFQEDETEGITWKCKGGTDKTFAKIILATMPEIDIQKSMEYFEQHGGFCDCEILFNVRGRE